MADRAVNVLHNRNMQNRYIEVFMSSEAEAGQANVTPPMQGGMMGMPMAPPTGSAPSWGDGPPNSLIKLRGLPFNATAEQVLAFFQGLELPKGVGGVHLVLGANGRPNGEAFVECGSEETAVPQLVENPIRPA